MGLCGNNYGEEPELCAQSTEPGGWDRLSIRLPDNQDKLLRAVVEQTDTPAVSAEAVDFAWATEHVDAIIWTGYAGQSGGQAIAEAFSIELAPEETTSWTF
eukprot:scaffold1007_cov176-Amphora_coffeaeformis.AAC.36